MSVISLWVRRSFLLLPVYFYFLARLLNRCSFFPFLFLVNEVGEVLSEEKDHIKTMVNYPVHAYFDLVTPDWLFQCGFGSNPGIDFLADFCCRSVPKLFLILSHLFCIVYSNEDR